MTARPLGRLLAAALVAVACAGCTTSGHHHTPATATPASASPATPDPSATPLPQARGTLAQYFTIRARLTGYQSLGYPAVDGDTVVVPAAKGNRPADSVLSVDATGNASVLARTTFPHGFVSAAKITGDWVAWVDQSAEQGDGVDDVSWRIVVRNLRTHRQSTLAASTAPTRYVPAVFATDGYVYWTTAEPDRTARQWIWRTGHGKPRTLFRHQELTPELESLDGGRLYFLGPSGKSHHGHTVGGDCWSVPLTGGSPTAVTATSLGMDCAAGGGWLVWSLHSDPAHPPQGEAFDDPYEIWARKGAGAPTLLHRGYVGGGSPRIGKDFAVWDGNGFLMYSGLDGKATVSLTDTSGAFAYAASGNRLAFVSSVGQHAATTLTVATRR